MSGIDVAFIKTDSTKADESYRSPPACLSLFSPLPVKEKLVNAGSITKAHE